MVVVVEEVKKVTVVEVLDLVQGTSTSTSLVPLLGGLRGLAHIFIFLCVSEPALNHAIQRNCFSSFSRKDLFWTKSTLCRMPGQR